MIFLIFLKVEASLRVRRLYEGIRQIVSSQDGVATFESSEGINKLDGNTSASSFQEFLCVCDHLFLEQAVNVGFVKDKQLNICISRRNTFIKDSLVLSETIRDENIAKVFCNC